MEIRQALARGYCSDRNKHKVLDLDLIEDMATEIEKLFQDAEMPQKSNDHCCIKYAYEIASTSNLEPCYACIRNSVIDDFLAYHLKIISKG